MIFSIGITTIPSAPAAFIELATHFIPIYAVTAFYTATGLWVMKARKWKIISAFALCIAFLIPVLSLTFPRTIARAEAYEDIDILQFNVNFASGSKQLMSGWFDNLQDIDRRIFVLVAESLPDMVVLQEVSPELDRKIVSLADHYPYQMRAPKAGAFGMVIYSRIPILSAERLPLENANVEYSRLELVTQAGPLTMYEVHARNPILPPQAKFRNAGLKAIGEIIAADKAENKLLIGDLNVTPYSPYLRQLETSSGLKNAMRGISISGTWPSFLPPFLRLPIDHLLVSERMEIIRREVLAHYGSDHLPVLTRLRLYKQE